jgi:hypothetical protein
MLRSSENIQNSAFTTRENYRAGNCKEIYQWDRGVSHAANSRRNVLSVVLKRSHPTMDVAAPQVTLPSTAVVVEEVASALVP